MSKQKEIKFEQPSFALLFFNNYISYIIIFIVVFVLIAGYIFLFIPKIEAIKVIKEDNTATVVKQRENEKTLARITDLANDYNKIKRDRKKALEDLKKLIPDEPQVAEIFVMVEKIALENNFSLNNITVSAEDEDNDKIKTASINITVTHVYEAEDEENDLLEPGSDGGILLDGTEIDRNGEDIQTTYEAFKQFIVALEDNLRLIDVTTVSFGTLPISEDGGPAQNTIFLFTLNTYFR